MSYPARMLAKSTSDLADYTKLRASGLDFITSSREVMKQIIQ